MIRARTWWLCNCPHAVRMLAAPLVGVPVARKALCPRGHKLLRPIPWQRGDALEAAYTLGGWEAAAVVARRWWPQAGVGGWR